MFGACQTAFVLYICFILFLSLRFVNKNDEKILTVYGHFLLKKLEMRSLERGIGPIVTSIMNELFQ